MQPTSEPAGSPSRSLGVFSAGLWLLPAYALLLAVSTLTHEPDHTTSFADWSEYVATDRFLVSHMVASVLGAGLGMTGVAAVMAHLVRGRARTSVFLGGAFTIVGNTMFVAMFGVAAFTQPAIGRAFQDGDDTMRAFYDEVYAAPLLINFAVGALLFLAGAVLLGLALARTSQNLRWAGYGYAASMTIFLVAGFTVSFLQPVAGVAAAAAGVVVALRLPEAVAEDQAEPYLRSRRA
ncbi:MAG: hypothetical protein ACXWW7_13860 [Nocardioides sp.]